MIATRSYSTQEVINTFIGCRTWANPDDAACGNDSLTFNGIHLFTMKRNGSMAVIAMLDGSDIKTSRAYAGTRYGKMLAKTLSERSISSTEY